MSTGTVEQIFEEIDKLGSEDRDYLAEVLPKRLAEMRRIEIAKTGTETMRMYRKGKLKSGSAEELLRDLND